MGTYKHFLLETLNETEDDDDVQPKNTSFIPALSSGLPLTVGHFTYFFILFFLILFCLVLFF